ncbi:MAG: putative toxin-antitoxin system toxin component, PIN family [Candidatus Bathyarchaeota archaeon]|nr:putative toxin-antitoxin system toxin component, PIN family [Candidatus Bathyarchaeota archaeon]
MLDTNVLVSAIISDGKPRELLRRGISKQFSIVTSELILKELGLVLRRPKFKTAEDEVNRIIIALMQTAEIVNVTSKLKVVEEDPKDNIVIETAYDGDAEIIVTGDRHLLALKEFKGIKITTVEQMLALLEEKRLKNKTEKKKES